MTLTAFDIEFFELAHTIKKGLSTDIILELKQKLLKLNNPTYYNKFITKHPGHLHGYYMSYNINPVLNAINNISTILKKDITTSEKQKLVEIEYAWAFNNFPKYKGLLNKNA